MRLVLNYNDSNTKQYIMIILQTFEFIHVCLIVIWIYRVDKKQPGSDQLALADLNLHCFQYRVYNFENKKMCIISFMSQ